MNIDELITNVKKKIKKNINIENILVEDKTFLHKNHAGQEEGKFHLKIKIKSNELKKLSKIESNKKIFKPYKKLRKAGVILHILQSNKYKQKSLFSDINIHEECNLEKLNKTIDDINNRYRRDTLIWGSSSIQNDWSPSRSQNSGTGN